MQQPSAHQGQMKIRFERTDWENFSQTWCAKRSARTPAGTIGKTPVPIAPLNFFLKATQKRMDFFNDISVSRIGSTPTFFLVQV